MNPLNLNIWVLDLVPRDSEHGTSNDGAGTSNGSAMCVVIRSSCAVIRGPSALSFEEPVDKLLDQQFWGFIDPSDQNELYHTPITIQYMTFDC